MPITLAAHDFEMSFRPELGGSVISLSWYGQPILRDQSAGYDTAFESAAYPLFPFSGRIAHGTFTFDGTSVQLPPGLPGEAHAIHGQGWTNPWTVAAQGDDHLHLTYQHTPDDWPWVYRAEQLFRLLPGAVEVELRLTSLDERPMPAGMGWHPHFVTDDARLSCPVEKVWLAEGEDALPSHAQPVTGAYDLTQPRPVSALDLDHNFSVRDPSGVIAWPERSVQLEMKADSQFGFMVIYTPPGTNFFCVEPVTHTANAVNMQDRAEEVGFQTLKPGAHMRGKIRLHFSVTQ